jgi:ssDNA-specific exonuclease RecJ
MKPANLIFVVSGGPNFEPDTSYNSLADYPGEKRKMVEVLRETGAEHIIFMAGDTHATYVTKASIGTHSCFKMFVDSILTFFISWIRDIRLRTSSVIRCTQSSALAPRRAGRMIDL